MADLAGKMIRFSVPRNIVKLGIAAFFVGLSLLGFFSYKMLEVDFSMNELDELRQFSLQQKKEIQKFAIRVKDFQKQVARLEKFDKKLRVITALDKSVSEPQNVFGVGGSTSRKSLSLDDRMGQHSASALNKLNEDLDHLSAKAAEREISFHELDAFFKDQSSLLTSTPSIWPTRGWVTSGFGYRISPFTGLRELHEGVDIATHMSADIIAVANGVIVESSRNGGYGNVIEVDHGYGIVTRYGHNSANLVKRGDRVKRGQLIAKVGNTGRSTGPHLHYEVLLNGVPVNPFRYILTE